MKIEFTVIFDTETGKYTADTKGIDNSQPKTKSLVDIADMVSKMFVELSKKYYSKILKENNYVTKKDKEEMN